MMGLCIVFGIITVISLTSLFLLLDDLKEITKQIDYKNKTNSHFDISVQSSVPSIKKLQIKNCEPGRLRMFRLFFLLF